jgi:hypothetical protein
MTRRLSMLIAACLALSAPAAHAEDEEVAKIMARYENEPTIRQVQVAAIEYYNVSPDTIRSLRGKARRKALMPGLSVGGSMYRQSFALAVDDIIYRPVGTARFEDSNSVYLGANASLTWNLDRLVFNAEELDVMALIGIQDGIQREVTTLYYVRRRLQIELYLSPPTTVAARVAAELRLEELTGLLDAYSGGFFTRASNTKKRKSS